MRFLIHTATLLLGLFLWAGSGHAAAKSDVLDQKAVHEAYNEANFDYVINILENFVRTNKSYSHSDSIFVAKHLAVVYSANPATREKGRYYMNRLLELVPSAKLVDMYVSEEIDRIFEKVREEFLTRQQSFGIESSAMNLPARPGQEPVSGSPGNAAAAPAVAPAKKGKGFIWFAGGVGVIAAVGTAAYFAMHETPPAEDKTFVVPR